MGRKKIYYEAPINNYEITRKIQLPQAGAVEVITTSRQLPFITVFNEMET